MDRPIDVRGITLIVPDNDLESRTIINIARDRLGFDDIRISEQGWGARLEKEPSGRLANLRDEVWIVEIPGFEMEQSLVEARPSLRLVAIDHHAYQEADRYNPLSSLEQFADLTNCRLTRIERLVAANDRGYLWAMIAEGATREEALTIRNEDFVAQGYTEADIALNRDAFNRIKKQVAAFWAGGNRCFSCEVSLKRTGYFVDLFYLWDDALYGVYEEFFASLKSSDSSIRITDPRRTILLVNEIGSALTVEVSGDTRYFPLVKKALGHVAKDFWTAGGTEQGYLGVLISKRGTRAEVVQLCETTVNEINRQVESVENP